MSKLSAIVLSIMLFTACARAEDPPAATPLTPCLAVDAAGRPIFPTPSFASGAKWMNASFHLTPEEQYARLSCEWAVVDVGDVAAPGTVIATADLALGETARNGGFNYSQSVPLPVGRYKLAVKADGKPWHEVEVAVHADPPPIELASVSDLFPLTEGATWTYDLLISAAEGISDPNVKADADGKVRAKVTLTVGPQEESGVRLDYVRDGTMFQQEWWVPTSEGMMIRKRILNGVMTEPSPPELIVAMPRGPMTEWTYPPGSTDGARYRMWGPLPIQTTQGERPGYVVVCRNPGSMTTTDAREYVPGIGMLRQTIVGSRDGTVAFEMNIGLASSAAPQRAENATDEAVASTAASAAPPFRTVDNAELPEGTGRIVIAYPEGTNCGSTETQIFTPDHMEKALTWKFGPAAFELKPGRYLVSIEGARVEDVEVASRRDTIITVGAVRVRAPKQIEVQVQDSTRKRLYWHFGSFDMGLPVGDYFLVAAGQAYPVTISENRITEHDVN